MAITAKDVQKLREMTGVGMMDCKKALTASEGDIDKAIEWLREKGLAAQTKKAGKVAAEGVSYAIVAEGAVIEEEATVGAPPSDDPDWGIAVVAGGVTVGPKAVIKPSAMIREDVKGGEQA